MNRVTTLTGSVYYIDGNQVCRFAGSASSALRHDGNGVTIVARGGIKVGQPMVFLLQKLDDDDGVTTARVTTPVVEIEEIGSVDELIESLREGERFLFIAAQGA